MVVDSEVSSKSSSIDGSARPASIRPRFFHDPGGSTLLDWSFSVVSIRLTCQDLSLIFAVKANLTFSLPYVFEQKWQNPSMSTREGGVPSIYAMLSE